MDDYLKQAENLSRLLEQSAGTPARLEEEALQIYSGDRMALIRNLATLAAPPSSCAEAAGSLMIRMGTCDVLLRELISSEKYRRISALVVLGSLRWSGGLPVEPAELEAAETAILEAVSPLVILDDDHEASVAVDAIGWFAHPRIPELMAGLLDSAPPRVVLRLIVHLASTREASRGLEAADRLIVSEPFTEVSWSAVDPMHLAHAIIGYLGNKDEQVVNAARGVVQALIRRLLAIAGTIDWGEAPDYETRSRVNTLDNAIWRVLECAWCTDHGIELIMLDSLLHIPALEICRPFAVFRLYDFTGGVSESWRRELQKDSMLFRMVAEWIPGRHSREKDYSGLMDILLAHMPENLSGFEMEFLAAACAATGKLTDDLLAKLPSNVSAASLMLIHWQKRRIKPAKALEALQTAGLLEQVSPKEMAKLKRLKVPSAGPVAWMYQVLAAAGRLFYCDTESSVTPPDYGVLIDGLASISGGFVVAGSTSACLTEDSACRVSFEAGGERRTVEVKDEGDWMDWEPVLVAANESLSRLRRTERFFCLPPDGQCIGVAFGDKKSLPRVAKKLGLQLSL